MASAKPRDTQVFAQIDVLLQEEFGGKQAAMAIALGVDEATVWRWHGRQSHPQMRYARVIAGRFEEYQLRVAARRQLRVFEREDEC